MGQASSKALAGSGPPSAAAAVAMHAPGRPGLQLHRQPHAEDAAGPPPRLRHTQLTEEERRARASELRESLKLLTAGGVAGAVSKTATAPLARLTILYQVQRVDLCPEGRPHSMWRAFRQIVQREGVAALWKGNAVTIVHRLPYSAVNFWTYERLTELWLRHWPPPPQGQASLEGDLLRRLVAGGAAGICACTIAYPLDLVRTRFAAQTGGPRYTSIGGALRSIVAAEGPRGLYRGLGATLLQVTPSLAINYSAYGTLRSQWVRSTGSNQPTVGASLACGGLAGLISSTATFPLDLIRRRMQMQDRQPCGKRLRYADVVRAVFRKHGVWGFYSGILPEYTKVIPGVAIGFCTYEYARQALGVGSSSGLAR